MVQLRYKGTTAGLLIAAVILCLYRAICYVMKLAENVGEKQTAAPSGTLLSYLEVTKTKADTTVIVISAVMLAAMLCFGVSAVIVLLKGTEELKLPVILCTVGIVAIGAVTCKAWFGFMMHLNDNLNMIVMTLVLVGLGMILYYLRSINRDHDKIIYILIAIMAAVLFTADEYINLPDYAAIDIFAFVLAMGGMTKAVRDDYGEYEEEEECEEEG